LGVELFRDIEDRWNRGCFGEEYDDCDDYRAEAAIGIPGARAGTREDLRGPEIHNDLTFIDEFLTLDFCRGTNFQFGYNEDRLLRDREPRVRQGQAATAV
jgi:stage V sporulation protein R